MPRFFDLVERFIDRNPVNPAEKFEFRIIISDVFKHLEKNCLGGIRCIIRIPQYPVCCVDKPAVCTG